MLLFLLRHAIMPDLRLDRESRLVVMEPLLGAPLFLACVGPPGLVIKIGSLLFGRSS
jgi:hypothetical protein